MFKRFMYDLFIAIILCLVVLSSLLSYMVVMPNVSLQRDAPPLTSAEQELAKRLENHVISLCKQGDRNYYLNNSLIPAKNYITDTFQQYGYQVSLQHYSVEKQVFSNIIIELLGTQRPTEIIIIGAHYDSVMDSPGANDNASGIAAVLELARLLQGQRLARTIRLVAFANEEPPFFQTDNMGSLVYATQLAKQQENVIGMFALETMGYYNDALNSQHYPPPFDLFYPNTGNFIAFVGNLNSRALVRESIASFRQQATIPSEGVAAPAFIAGIGWSDHWAFWKNDYPALMVTDTAFYRYPYYHTAQDTPDKLNYEKMARVVVGMQKVIETLANK